MPVLGQCRRFRGLNCNPASQQKDLAKAKIEPAVLSELPEDWRQQRWTGKRVRDLSSMPIEPRVTESPVELPVNKNVDRASPYLCGPPKTSEQTLRESIQKAANEHLVHSLTTRWERPDEELPEGAEENCDASRENSTCEQIGDHQKILAKNKLKSVPYGVAYYNPMDVNPKRADIVGPVRSGTLTIAAAAESPKAR